jgi:hypothetical protein
VPTRTRRRVNAVVALFLLDRPDAVRKWLGQSRDPDLRTALIGSLPTLVQFDALWPLSRPPSSDLTRQAILLAADSYISNNRLPPDARRRLAAEMAEVFARDESAAVHSAAEWLLRRLGEKKRLDEINADLAGKKRPNWWVTPEGHTMVLVRGPDEMRIVGEDGTSRVLRIDHSFAIATHEVTVRQFRKYFPNQEYAENVTVSPE